MHAIIEIECPRHGIERKRLIIVRRFNVHPRDIILLFSEHKNIGEIKKITIGRNIKPDEVYSVITKYYPNSKIALFGL